MRVRPVLAVFAMSALALTGCATGTTASSSSSSAAPASTSAADTSAADGSGAESSAEQSDQVGGGSTGGSSGSSGGAGGSGSGGGVGTGSTSQGAGADSTGTDDAECGMPTSAAAQEAADKLPLPFVNGQWSAENAELDGYDPCAEFSWIKISVDDGGQDMPWALVLFHKGVVLGPATHQNYGYPEVARVDDVTIDVTYRWGIDDDPETPPTESTTVRFTYKDGWVNGSGELPPPQ